MRRRVQLLTFVAASTVGACLIGWQIVRAQLHTERVGVTPDYELVGPANLGATVISTRSLELTWTDRDAEEGGFYVYRNDREAAVPPLPPFQVPAQAGSGGSVTFRDSTVLPDHCYGYTVRSFLGPALSPPTSTAESLCTRTAPLPPTNLVARAVGTDAMSVTWEDNSTNETGFLLVEAPRDNLANTRNINLTANTTEVTVAGLTSLTEYCYQVYAENANGLSEPEPLALPDGDACARTWSIQPELTNVRVANPGSPYPLFAWDYSDPDGDSTYAYIEAQVCANDFLGPDDDGCTDWRWDSGPRTGTANQLAYLDGYLTRHAEPEPQHPLDFGRRYYARLRAWDDSGTPSGWVPIVGSYLDVSSAAPGLSFDFTTNANLSMSGGELQADAPGGQLRLTDSIIGTGDIVGTFPNTDRVVSARLRVSATPIPSNGTPTWSLYREGDAAWQEVTLDGDNLVDADGYFVTTTWASDPGVDVALQWRLAYDRSDGPVLPWLIGGLKVDLVENEAPRITSCTASPSVGSTLTVFGYAAGIADDGDAADLEVRWDWDGNGTWDSVGPTDEWVDWPGPPPLETTAPPFGRDGVFRAVVQARDVFGPGDTAECSPVLVGSASAAWLSTERSDIYSGVDVVTLPPYSAGDYTATYLIQAGGVIRNATSEGLGCYRDASDPACAYLRESYPRIGLPRPSTVDVLTTILGRVDVPGILAGRYLRAPNMVVEPVTNLSDWFASLPSNLDGSVQLGGRTVQVNGSAVIEAGRPVVIGPGRGTPAGDGTDDGSGAGVIFVDGDLFIRAPVRYSTAAVQKLSQLPSLGWIVTGNVIIAPDVGVDNTPSGCNPEDRVGLPLCGPAVVGTFYAGGTFFTGTQRTSADLTLMVGGTVVARQFALQRYRNDGLPGEVFRYDGRIFANPPPGLQDLAKALPRWRPRPPSAQP